MSGYLFEGILDNSIHEINSQQIHELHNQNLRESSEGHKITASSYANQTCQTEKDWLHGFEQDILLRDPKTAGYIIQYPHGVVIEQSMRRNYFRGENQIFDESVPSLHRPLKRINTQKDKELYRLVADMRVAEFDSLLRKFDHVRNWKYCDILSDLLAQHYGLETDWLDITSDFDVAMFFATCQLEDGKWKPLTKRETEINEEHQYGMIFHMPSCQNARRLSFSSELFGCDGTYYNDTNKCAIHKFPKFIRPLDNLILPVGFQPFMRCHMQNGYAIYMRSDNPLQNDVGFEKLRFRQNEKLSQKYYEFMEGGKKIYPHEGLSQANFIIDKIKKLTSFSEKAFQYALYRSHYYSIKDEARCRRDLEKYQVDGKNIIIKADSDWHITPGRRKRIDTIYSNFSIESWYHIQLRSRKKVNGGAGMFAPWMLPEKEGMPGIVDFKPRQMEPYCDNIWTRDLIRILSMIEHAKFQDF